MTPDSHDEEKDSPQAKIREFGYHFKDGKLLKIDKDEGFTFTTQRDYEALGDAIGLYVYEKMEENGLEKIELYDEETGGYFGFVFGSPEYSAKETLVVLIHGSGVVKAGQWARKLIINEGMEAGTQLPYIKRAMEKDWGVLVLNYNEECDKAKKLTHSCTDCSHGLEEWRLAVESSVPSTTRIFVVAHSYGGYVISQILRKYGSSRVATVCLTDAGFSAPYSTVANWCTSKSSLSKYFGVYQLYSGNDTHEGTSAAAINSIFHLLESNPDRSNFADLLQECEDIVKEEVNKRKKEESIRRDLRAAAREEKRVKREGSHSDEKEDDAKKTKETETPQSEAVTEDVNGLGKK